MESQIRDETDRYVVLIVLIILLMNLLWLYGSYIYLFKVILMFSVHVSTFVISATFLFVGNLPV